MAERHQKILKAVSQIAETLFRSTNWEDAMSSVLRSLGESVEVSHCYLFECHHIHSQDCTSSIRFEWVAEGISPQIENLELQNFSWKENDLLEWKEILHQGKAVIAHIEELPASCREHFLQQDIKSLLLVPVTSGTDTWGFLGFDDCLHKREWAVAEIESLRTVANILGSAIRRFNAEKLLLDANERYQLAEKAGGIGTWEWNIATGELVWTDNIEGMFGFREGEFGKTYDDFLACVYPEDRAGLKESVRASLEDDEDYVCHHRIVWPDGSVRWMLETGEVYRDARDQPVRMLGVVQDITDDIDVVTALQQSEQRFKDLVESTSDWIWEIDANGCYTYVSPKVTDILGFNPDELIGKTPFELMPEKEAVRVSSVFKEISDHKSTISQLVNVNLHSNGHEVVLETSGVPILDENGGLLGYRGIVRDISRRVLSERALKESEAIFKQLAENVNEVFYVRDVESDRLIYLSPSSKRFFGQELSMDSLSLDSLIAMLHPDDSQDVLAGILRQEMGEGIDQEFRVVLPSGEGKWVWLRTFPIKNAAGKVYRIAGLVEDITERMRAQELRLEQERRQRDALIREVHHRIKNNLQSIIGLLRLQLGEYEELHDVLERVIGQVQSIAMIHGLQGRSGVMYLCEIVHAIGMANKRMCADEQLIDMHIQTENGVVIREEDMVPVALIINELLTNAMKYGKTEDERIHFELVAEGERAKISIVNALPKGDKSVTDYPEPGIGLGMVNALMPVEGADLKFGEEQGRYFVEFSLFQPVISHQADHGRSPELGSLIL